MNPCKYLRGALLLALPLALLQAQTSNPPPASGADKKSDMTVELRAGMNPGRYVIRFGRRAPGGTKSFGL